MGRLFSIGNRTTAGTYTGDGTQNRAIPHGLGVVPKFVFLQTTSMMHAYTSGKNYWLSTDMSSQSYTPTAATSVNFYVGSAAANFYGNVGSVVYYWIAFY